MVSIDSMVPPSGHMSSDQNSPASHPTPTSSLVRLWCLAESNVWGGEKKVLRNVFPVCRTKSQIFSILSCVEFLHTKISPQYLFSGEGEEAERGWKSVSPVAGAVESRFRLRTSDSAAASALSTARYHLPAPRLNVSQGNKSANCYF